jgi:hypothetical protein
LNGNDGPATAWKGFELQATLRAEVGWASLPGNAMLLAETRLDIPEGVDLLYTGFSALNPVEVSRGYDAFRHCKRVLSVTSEDTEKRADAGMDALILLAFGQATQYKSIEELGIPEENILSYLNAETSEASEGGLLKFVVFILPFRKSFKIGSLTAKNRKDGLTVL